MSQFGELFGPGKLRKESSDDQGAGERFEHGPLDLDSGVIRIRPLPKTAKDTGTTENSGKTTEPDETG